MCGLSTRKIDHALLDPEREDALELVPQRLPVVRLEIERIDVLIFLRRVLCVLHGAVRAPAEPRRVLFHVGVVRRALEGDVEREVDAALLGALQQAAEFLQRAQLGVQRLVTAFRRADRPRTARLTRLRHHCVVPPLAKLVADGMYRRQIEHVKAHLRDVRDTLLAFGEGAVGAACRHAGAWEHLVPRAEARAHRLDDDASGCARTRWRSAAPSGAT